MNLRRLSVYGVLFVVLVFSTLFVACDLTGGNDSKVDVTLSAAGIIRGDGGRIDGISVWVMNSGEPLTGAGIEVMLTLNGTSPYAGTLYKGRVDLPTGEPISSPI